jgi:hypothetical protein
MKSLENIPQNFIQNIQLHLIRNFWSEINKSNALIMGIAGPPGEGKSFQCRQVLETLGYLYVEMDTSDFGSALEAESAKGLCAKYVEASVSCQITKKPHAIIIDDIDMAVGHWGALTQYTVNLQYAIGELMHLCDSPTSVRVEPGRLSDKVRKAIGNPTDKDVEINTSRIPIFVTGNDFTKLYAPLLRDGRMTKFEWIPTEDEKASVVAGILEQHITPSESKQLVVHCTELAKKHKVVSPPISFYAALKNRVLDDFILATVQKTGWASSYSLFTQQGSSVALKYQPTYQNYLTKADECVMSLVNQSHLNEESKKNPQLVERHNR